MSDIITTDQINSIGSSLVDGGSSLINLIIQLLPFIIAFTVILIIYGIIKNRFGKLNTGGFSKNNFKYHKIQDNVITLSDSWKLHQMNVMVKNDPELTRINPDLGFGYNYRLRNENGNKYVVYDASPFGDTEYMTDYIRGSKDIDKKYKEMKRYYNGSKYSK